MVTWTNNDDRETYIANRWKPKKANVAPINSGQDDWRSAYLRKSFADNVNATREQNAINARNNDLQYAMSRSPDWYQNKNNLRSIKNVLVNTPAVTTDMNESRNMYQMLMNQMKGGDRGARLIDTSGLPAGARRIGRTLFQDPSKSAGFLGDLSSMFLRTPNPAAVRAPEYNPFPKAGFGKEFYKDEFGGFDFGNLMEGIMKIATPLKYLPKRERTPLERDSRFYPENNVFDLEFDKVEPIPFMGDELDNEFNWFDAYAPFDAPFNAEQLRSEGKGGLFELEDNIIPIPEDSIERIISEDGQVEIDMDEASENIELTDDRKAELKALLSSPEFQALPWLEQLPILESYGYTEPDLLSGIN